ncbi:glycosyltransferase family 39 protein, partial [Nitrospinaceae bacterium]|nr:glycosyltransferase family 39 protein [Nitrospinaceae bacterium]
MKPERLLKCIQVCTGHLLSVSLLFFVTAFLHFPLLLNSSLILQFDEAIQASEIIRLMKGEAFFFYFDYARYHGILHGVLAIPFFWLLGISATAYKLTPVLFYAAYIWTTYLLAKIINKKVALITLILLIIPSLTMSSMATHNWQNSLIIVLGNLILLLYFKANSSNTNTPWIFGLFFFLGLSIYEYSYVIIYFATILIMFTLSHPFWGEIRSNISYKKIVHVIKDSDSLLAAILKILDGIILLMFMATFFAYVWGGFAIDIFNVSIFQIHKFHKAALQVLVLILIRLAVSRKFLLEYQQWVLGLIQKVEPKHWKVIGYCFSGFIIGISPRIISIFQGNTSKGGKGFDMNIDPFTLLDHLWVLITVRIPEILGIREPIVNFFTQGSYKDIFSTLNATAA